MQVTAGRDALPPGTRVGGWIIEQALGRDDIAVSYVARDVATNARLEIEEYLPESIARREDDDIVHPRSPALTAAFEAGRRAFLEEARQLAQPLHPALLQVIASWQSNGTAYRALPLLADEPTLDRLRPTPAEMPSEARLRALLEPLADALAALHAASLVHGNVRPGNIVMRGGGSPLLLGFDSARWALADLATHPEPGFLAIEQTERYGALPAGPWTDLYALGAIALYSVAGRAPSPAMQRIATGSETPFAEALAEQQQRFPTLPAFAPGLVAAVDRALKVAPGQRPRSIAEWRLALADPVTASPATPIDSARAEAARSIAADIVLDARTGGPHDGGGFADHGNAAGLVDATEIDLRTRRLCRTDAAAVRTTRCRLARRGIRRDLACVARRLCGADRHRADRCPRARFSLGRRMADHPSRRRGTTGRGCSRRRSAHGGPYRGWGGRRLVALDPSQRRLGRRAAAISAARQSSLVVGCGLAARWHRGAWLALAIHPRGGSDGRGVPQLDRQRREFGARGEHGTVDCYSAGCRDTDISAPAGGPATP